MMKGLSKSRIMAYRQCPKRLWLQSYKPEFAEQDSYSSRAMAVGISAGEVARGLFAGGQLIETDDITSALSQTQKLMAQNPAKPIYEAALAYDGVLVFIDILVPEGDGWHLIEVKSATSVKDYYKPDATVQTWVAKKAGVTVSRTSIACIDSQFLYPGNGNYDGLFYLTDITDIVGHLLGEVDVWVDAARVTLSGDEPVIGIGDHRSTPFDCPFFEAYCRPPKEQLPEYPVTDSPNSRKVVTELTELGYKDLTKVPSILLSNPKHQRIHQSVVSGKPFISDAVSQLVKDIPYPRYYLDFETIQFTVPIWVGSRPYQQIPFQWSCHVETEDGVLQHKEFLAEGREDPRHGFAYSLAELLDNEGTIIAYNAGFERSRIVEMADQFPALAPVLRGAAQRLVDLLSIAREHYYHPAMHGSWSIKYVLPAVAPDLTYQGMEVADGMMAQDAYLDLLSEQLSLEEVASKRNALIRYCRQDTYAMVKIAHFFQNGGQPKKLSSH